MNKIKVIDLLNMISKGEEVPKKIKCNGSIFDLDENNSYYCDDINCASNWLSNEFIFGNKDLNDEVEIIEEDKKIARLNQDNFQCVSNLEVSGQSANYFEYGIEDEIRDIVDKINEIIDYLMEKK